MEINILSLSDGAKTAKGITVIIDVYRAFTTQSFAFENGVKDILNVSDIEQALNMKENGLDYWSSPNTGATNSSGFTGLPGGSFTNICFIWLRTAAYFWTSTESQFSYPIVFELKYNKNSLSTNYYDKYYGLSVRCVGD